MQLAAAGQPHHAAGCSLAWQQGAFRAGSAQPRHSPKVSLPLTREVSDCTPSAGALSPPGGEGAGGDGGGICQYSYSGGAGTAGLAASQRRAPPPLLPAAATLPLASSRRLCVFRRLMWSFRPFGVARPSPAASARWVAGAQQHAKTSSSKEVRPHPRAVLTAFAMPTAICVAPSRAGRQVASFRNQRPLAGRGSWMAGRRRHRRLLQEGNTARQAAGAGWPPRAPAL